MTRIFNLRSNGLTKKRGNEMSDSIELVAKRYSDPTEGYELLERLIAVAHADSVYSKPVVVGDYTVITASELSIGMGFGFGGGGGSSPSEVEGEKSDQGFGGGGGGGGGSTARPVAVIEIGPNGVKVEPIVDPTKISLALFTMLISMLSMLRKLRKS
jgi:uncharacterized spore protein YtfJ